MTGGVTVSVSVRDTTETNYALSVAVQDTGIGISEAAQKKLFGMFMKIKDARVRNSLGVLHLASCILHLK